MKLKEESVEILYTAYVELENEKGFIHYEHGQGESLLFLVENLEDADFFESKDVLRMYVSQDCSHTNLEFYTKKITTITEISKTI